jgi:hypothetical protein
MSMNEASARRNFSRAVAGGLPAFDNPALRPPGRKVGNRRSDRKQALKYQSTPISPTRMIRTDPRIPGRLKRWAAFDSHKYLLARLIP